MVAALFEFCRPLLLVWSPSSLFVLVARRGVVDVGRSMFVWLARGGDLDARLGRAVCIFADVFSPGASFWPRCRRAVRA